jgi:broad specificity phosphatase PhoE
MSRFLLIRHATTDDVGHRLSGRNPGVPLNAEGHAQAKQIATNLASIAIDHIYSSPMERAISTAKPLSERLHLPIHTHEAFNEIDFGTWTNGLLSELEQDTGFRLFNQFRSNVRIPGGELMLEAQTRIVSGIQKIAEMHPSSIIAVFSHSDMIRAAVTHYLGMSLDLISRIEISPASVTILDIYKDTSRIMLLNYQGEIKK